MEPFRNNLANDILRPCARSAVLKTLCYADIFDYPLKKNELFHFLISKNKVSKKSLSQLLNSHIPGVGSNGKYFFLDGKRSLVFVRQKRAIESKKKMEKAKRIASLLSFIPFIQFVGVSGSLSMDNSRRNDDIDLFIVTARKRLWITRFLVVIFLNIVGQRRKPKDIFTTDKICPNMFVNEDCMKITKRNLFSAHEIVQVKPLWNKNSTYEKFLAENIWVKNFLPNSIPYYSEKILSSEIVGRYSVLEFLLDKVEILFYFFQYAYMQRHKTSEDVQLSIAAFHPRDMKKYVLQLYRLKYKFIFKDTVGVKTKDYSRILT